MRFLSIIAGKSKRIILTVFFALSVLLIYSYFIEPNSLKTENVTFELGCLESGDAGKFVQISDFHFTEKTSAERIERIYQAVVGAEPEAVFMTGDYIGNENGLPAVASLVKKISARVKIYAVFGNWDYDLYGPEAKKLREVLESSGARVLENETEVLEAGKEKINIVGIRDPYTSANAARDLQKALSKAENGRCRLLLAHSPDAVPAAQKENIDLLLSGHTHGGQVYIPYLTRLFIPVHKGGAGFVKGAYKAGQTQLYVNRGIGLSFFPLRFNSIPEVTVINFKK